MDSLGGDSFRVFQFSYFSFSLAFTSRKSLVFIFLKIHTPWVLSAVIGSDITPSHDY